MCSSADRRDDVSVKFGVVRDPIVWPVAWYRTAVCMWIGTAALELKQHSSRRFINNKTLERQLFGAEKAALALAFHRFGRLGSWSWRLRCTLDVALARRGLVGLVAWGVRRGARGPGAVRSRRAERRACRKRIYIYI